jgi:hypothetical protein
MSTSLERKRKGWLETVLTLALSTERIGSEMKRRRRGGCRC